MFTPVKVTTLMSDISSYLGTCHYLEGVEGLVQIERRSVIFMQGKRGRGKLCMYNRELYYTKGHKEGGSPKNVPHKREDQENLNIAFLHLHQSSTPINNDRSFMQLNPDPVGSCAGS